MNQDRSSGGSPGPGDVTDSGLRGFSPEGQVKCEEWLRSPHPHRHPRQSCKCLLWGNVHFRVIFHVQISICSFKIAPQQFFLLFTGPCTP